MRNLSKNTVKTISKITEQVVAKKQSLPDWIEQLNYRITIRNANNKRLKQKALYSTKTIYIH